MEIGIFHGRRPISR